MIDRISVKRIVFSAKLMVVLLATSFSALGQQVCSDRVLHTTPSHRFEIPSSDIAVDVRTGLVWMRCPMGFKIDERQTPTDYSDDACVEDEQAYFEWQGAHQAVESVNVGNFAGYSDWRVPNIKELVTLVERKCIRPALNTAVFPALPFTRWWSSTTYENFREAAYVDFEYGVNLHEQKTREHLVRLVRGTAPQ